MSAGNAAGWKQTALTVLLVFVMAAVGCAVVFGLWLHDFRTPQVAFLGSGDRLSLLVIDGPARLMLATGDDPIEFENALAEFRPLFARRVDVLVVAGEDDALLVPLRAQQDNVSRRSFLLAPPPAAPGYEAFARTLQLSAPRRIRLGPSITVTVETALPPGALPSETAPYWRATIERAESRIIVLSDGNAAALFPPPLPAAVLAVAGDDPAAAWDLSPAIAFIANSGAISGPELRSAFTASHHPPQWGFRVAPGEALRLHFTEGGVELPSDAAQPLSGTPAAD